MQMPEVDGMMLASRIRKQPELAGIKLLLLTSLGHQFKKQTLTEAGIAIGLDMPVDGRIQRIGAPDIVVAGFAARTPTVLVEQPA